MENLENTIHPSGQINPRIGEILDCGMRYAKFDLSLRRNSDYDSVSGYSARNYVVGG